MAFSIMGVKHLILQNKSQQFFVFTTVHEQFIWIKFLLKSVMSSSKVVGQLYLNQDSTSFDGTPNDMVLITTFFTFY